ncbi:hypothetical protein MKX03_036147 [Papaver bracteatum]|nr:hypothetical protein MKX03_036147 [Papaver bracteatum]
MIVRIKDDEKKNPWVFLKPLSLELWLSAFGVFTFTGCVIWVLEHQINGNFRGNDLSRLVLIIWVFVVLVLTSSYTASLSSTLTIQQLAVNDLRNGEAYYNEQEYAEALSKGSQKGGVAAIFDEIPYLRLFLSKYCDRYAMTGPIYNTNGFGFVSSRYFGS